MMTVDVLGIPADIYDELAKRLEKKAGIKKERGEWQGHVGAFQKLDGLQHIEDVILVDQSPIGRTPRSNPVTYIKVYDAIRETFASTR